MESPADYLESPTEGDDIAYPCKGCGDILEEGKAFELAGNRWHLNCFRCNTCGTLLDSDANLLLLGDGSLICNSCTYSCSACNNKIEDLAILTGDQAFCATCFRCRNCKRKIENLRYARTSQGIFCMSCHESLMARRRKKSRAAAANKAKEKEQQQQQQQTMLVEKSLPALPPNAIPQGAFSSDHDTLGLVETDMPTELSPRPQTNYADSSSRSSSRRPQSPERSGEVKDGLLPSTTYRNHRHSRISQASEANGDGDFFIPLALDPSPAPANNAVTPQSVAESYNEAIKPNGKSEKDYFGISKSTGRSQTNPTPAHIAFQEKGRQMSSDFTESPSDSSRKGSLSTNKPARDDTRLQHASKDSAGVQSPSELFRLQEVPKSKKSLRSDSQSDLASPTSSLSPPSRSQQRSESNRNLVAVEQDSRPSTDSTTSSQHKGESGNSVKSPILRKDVPNPTMKSSMDLSSGGNTSPSSASSTEAATVNGKSISGPLVQSPTSDELVPPSRALARPSLPQQKLSDTYMAPRAPPAPPTANDSDEKLPRWSAGADFTMDEDMARILGGTDEGSQSILRRVSNAVRHGRTSSEQSARAAGSHSRSMSETTRTTISPKTWQKINEDGNPTVDISSPISVASPISGADPAILRRQLRNSEQRVAELERQITAGGDMLTLDKKLSEKRKTVSVLDSQAELIIRQIEILAGLVEKSKASSNNLNFPELEETGVKNFIEKIEKLKQGISGDIQAAYEELNGLLEEKAAAIADRDRALMEFEQLASKNAQLTEMNNDLTHQIQERFKAQSGSMESPRPPMGLYTHSKERSNASVHLDDASQRPSTGSTLLNSTSYPQSMDHDMPIGEGATVVAAPHVVNIRKGQAKKFNWKKGGQSVAKGVTKGFKGAFGAVNAQPQNQWGQTSDSIGMPYNMTAAPSEFPSTIISQNNLPRSISNDPRQAGGFGLFGKKGGQMPKSQSNGNILAQAGAEHPSVLFGSDLVERADHERRQIPSVVTRCIEEVELRGMDVEGIYRKTGGTGQVNIIKEGFEKTEDYDISDPDLDITAVTSVLKQYFRKLPTPLLTFDIYDRVLESTFVEDEEERCVHLRQTFNSLPPKHRDCLEFLIFHLARVASREKENLMTPKNLAVVFAPTIMRDTSLEREMTDMHAKNLAVQFVIENSNEIFGGA